MPREVEVWNGAWAASPPTEDNFRRFPRWDTATLLETKGSSAYVSGPGGTRWVSPNQWREKQ